MEPAIHESSKVFLCIYVGHDDMLSNSLMSTHSVLFFEVFNTAYYIEIV